MTRINFTIDSVAKPKYIQIDFLASSGSTVIGTRYISLWQIVTWIDELDGWRFNFNAEDPHNQKVYFSQIVNYNGSAVGATTQAQITTAILAAIGKQAQQV